MFISRTSSHNLVYHAAIQVYNQVCISWPFTYAAVGPLVSFCARFGSCTQETVSQLPAPIFRDQTWDRSWTSARV
ncbi:hypothetical protein LguiA_005045 [Lonicera macranthoides]